MAARAVVLWAVVEMGEAAAMAAAAVVEWAERALAAAVMAVAAMAAKAAAASVLKVRPARMAAMEGWCPHHTLAALAPLLGRTRFARPDRFGWRRRRPRW